MSPEVFKDRLIEHGERYALEGILLNSKPVLFATKNDYEQWRGQIAHAAKLELGQVTLTGSAVMGFSLAPRKFGRTFNTTATAERPSSDIDIAVVDTELFHNGWAAILDQDRSFRLRLLGEDKTRLMQNVYYGFLPEKLTPRSSRAFQKMIALRSICGRHPASAGIRVNMRIYHRQEDFSGYQIASLRTLKRSFNP